MKRALHALLILVALVLFVQLLNLVVARPSGTTLGLLGASAPHLRPVAALFEHKCANCHTTEVERPFYAWLPGLRGHIEHQLRAGMGEFDLVSELLRGDGVPVSEPALAKIEYVVDRHTMPPGGYRSMHWDAHLDDADRQEILAWVRAMRRRHYASEGIPPVVQENALQPLPAVDPRLDSRAVALGEKLFGDVRLSADNTVSCASCHDVARAGCDRERFSRGVHGQRGAVNTPTVFNAVFHRTYGWGGGAESLEAQAARPVTDPLLMGANWPAIAARLAQDAALAQEFRAVYPDGFSKASVTRALAAYQRTLVTPGARFDRYLLGETGALTDAERRGYALFRQHGCQTCHVGNALGGQSFERLGRRADYFGERGGEFASDAGRQQVTGNPEDRHRFKVPSLRNVARTAPYLHDGSVADVPQAVRVMMRYQVGTTPSDADVNAIATFLESLTGAYRGAPL